MKPLLTLLIWAALLLAPTTRAAQPPLPLTWRDTGITATGRFMCLAEPASV